MSQRSRSASEEVTKFYDNFIITLYRKNSQRQGKSILYNMFKKIEGDKIDLPIPFNTLKNIKNIDTLCFYVELDNTLTFRYSL